MDKVWAIVQDFKIDENESWDYDLISAWSTKELGYAELERLKTAGYRRIHCFPVVFNG